MKCALITGVTGQDGIYLAEFLYNKGYKVFGTTRKTNKNCHRQNLLRDSFDVGVIEVNLLNKQEVIGIIKKTLPNEIYNFAAQSSVSKSFKSPEETFIQNTSIVSNILVAIKEISHGIKLFQASSSEMFGDVKKLPVTLEHTMKPTSPYGVSKLSSHYLVDVWRESYGLFLVNGVMFNHESVYRGDEFFINKLITNSVKIKFNLLDNLEFGNLNVWRDFGFAKDYMKAVWLCLQQKEPQNIIICSGKSMLLKDLVDYVFDSLNIKSKIIINKKLFRPNELIKIVGCIEGAKSKLNWENNRSFYETLDILIKNELSKYE